MVRSLAPAHAADHAPARYRFYQRSLWPESNAATLSCVGMAGMTLRRQC